MNPSHHTITYNMKDSNRRYWSITVSYKETTPVDAEGYFETIWEVTLKDEDHDGVGIDLGVVETQYAHLPTRVDVSYLLSNLSTQLINALHASSASGVESPVCAK